MKQAYYLQNIDRNFWRRVKSHAALEGKSIRKLIIELLEREVRKAEVSHNVSQS